MSNGVRRWAKHDQAADCCQFQDLRLRERLVSRNLGGRHGKARLWTSTDGCSRLRL